MTEDMRRLVLASTSPYKESMLHRLGVDFDLADPHVDEGPLQRQIKDPVALTERLASAKAESLAGRFPDALLIGTDQVATIDGDILTKPYTEITAHAQLRRLAGKTHDLVTAVAVHNARIGKTFTAHTVHRLTMRPLSDGVLRAYIKRDKPLDCAGAYRLEEAGITLFAHIEGGDDSGIMGLPLIPLCDLLVAAGYPLFAFPNDSAM